MFLQVLRCGGNAWIGALVGILLTAFGAAISGSPLGVQGTLVVGGLLGLWLGRLPGLAWGVGLAVLAVAFGSLIGGSWLGGVLTVAVCAGIAAWVHWQSDERRHMPTPVVSPAQTKRWNDGPVDLDPCVGDFGLGDARPHVRLCSRV